MRLRRFQRVPRGSFLELQIGSETPAAFKVSALVKSGDQEHSLRDADLVPGPLRVEIGPSGCTVQIAVDFHAAAQAVLTARVLRPDGSTHSRPWTHSLAGRRGERELVHLRVEVESRVSFTLREQRRSNAFGEEAPPVLTRGTSKPRRSPQARPPSARRYANAALLDAAGHNPLDRSLPIADGREFRLRLDIGPLSTESQIDRPQPFPDQILRQDAWLDVMLASSHFAVAASQKDLGHAPVAHGRLFLPADGSPAVAPDGSKYLHFWLRAPETPQRAVARVGFYYRNALLQSVRLAAEIAEGEEGFTLGIDYTVSETLADLHLIPRRPRISVVTNDNGNGRHQITVRSARGEATGPSTSFELDERTIGGVIEKLRTVLRAEGVAPVERRRSRNDLIEDLRRLAPLGWELHTALAGQFLDAWNAARRNPEGLVVHVSRPASASFTLPWSFLYEIYLDSEIDPRDLKICELIDRWDGKKPLISGQSRQCPLAAEPWHRENVLCPFGFWGYRYSIEQLSSTDRPVTRIAAVTEPAMAVGLTQYEVDLAALESHLRRVGEALQAGIPGASLKEAKSKREIRELLGRDLALVYFYCHGERLHNRGPAIYLGVGHSERITPGDFIGWIQRWLQDDRVVWNQVRPLIFINACHSVEISPDTLISYLDAFIGTGRAAGVIGTEVKVSQSLAMELAAEFFQLFSRQGYSVDRALREVRLGFLKDGNLFGLLYTSYCWADLHLAR